MQRGLRNVERASALLKHLPIASTSRIRWEARRNASFGNPINWLRERLGPTVRQKETEEAVAAARQQATEEGKRNLFETVSRKAEKEGRAARAAKATELVPKKPRKLKPTSHKYSTANFKISHRKLNMLGRQIAGKPIDYAILQMQFSEKRASHRIKSMLVTAKSHAVRYKDLNESKLVVAESWVTKGPKSLKRMEPRGRGHFGIRVHPDSRMHVVLKEGKTLEEKKAEERAKKLKRIVSAAYVREDRPLRNPGPMWGW